MRKVDWRGPLVELGFDVPKTEDSIEVDDTTQQGADELFKMFVAWKNAGFTIEESFELSKSLVQGMGQSIASNALDQVKTAVENQQ